MRNNSKDGTFHVPREEYLMMCRRIPWLALVAAFVFAIESTGSGLAQPAPPGAAAPLAPSDPPARVGRLAHISGTVSFHADGVDRWEQATPNYPVTSGDALWTEPAATADV